MQESRSRIAKGQAEIKQLKSNLRHMMSNYDRMKGMLADYQQKESADTGGKDAENAKNEASMLRYVFCFSLLLSPPRSRLSNCLPAF